MMISETKYFSKGTIIADSREKAKGLMVITSGSVDVELPIESAEAIEENRKNGKKLLFVFGRGCCACKLFLMLAVTLTLLSLSAYERMQ